MENIFFTTRSIVISEIEIFFCATICSNLLLNFLFVTVYSTVNIGIRNVGISWTPVVQSWVKWRKKIKFQEIVVNKRLWSSRSCKVDLIIEKIFSRFWRRFWICTIFKILAFRRSRLWKIYFNICRDNLSLTIFENKNILSFPDDVKEFTTVEVQWNRRNSFAIVKFANYFGNDRLNRESNVSGKICPRRLKLVQSRFGRNSAGREKKRERTEETRGNWGNDSVETLRLCRGIREIVPLLPNAAERP